MSIVEEEVVRRELAVACREMADRGGVANHDGNATARLGDGQLLCTPTATRKVSIKPESLLLLDSNGKVLRGSRKPMGELNLHRAAYAARPDIGVVLHAHPPNACAWACSEAELPHPFLAEAVVSLGARLPRVAFGAPGSAQVDAALRTALSQSDVVFLEGHGLLSVGGSAEQAFVRLELVEHLSRIALLALPLGGVRKLPIDIVTELAAKGRPASQPSFGEKPTAEGDSERSAADGGSGERPDLARLVGDAIGRFRG